MDDDGESVKLTFGTLPAGVSEGGTDETVVTITDDDVPDVKVGFEQAAYTVDEGSSVSVKVTLDEAPERSVTIPINKTDQDGASGDDYSGVPRNVTFGAAETEKTITFQATDDDVDDDGESVKLTFGATLPTGVTKDDTDETTVSITDDDAPAGAVTLVLSHTTIAESGSRATPAR